MAHYASSKYGASFYGAPALSLFSAAPFTARATGYGAISLDWSSPGGTWDVLKLVKNGLGYPADEDNGTTVLTAEAGNDPRHYEENGLSRDRWMYYSIFVHDNTQDEWIRSGNARIFVPADYASGARLFDLAPPVASSEALRAFLAVVGFGVDLVRNDANSLLDLNDTRRSLYDLLPAAMGQLGVPFEPELEPEQYRKFSRNAVRFYKTKGTPPCVHGVVSAVAGYQAQVSVGTNILWDAEYSGFTGGIGRWADGEVNATVFWDATDHVLRMTSNGGTMTTSFVTPATSRQLGLPVDPARDISAAFLMRAYNNTSLRAAHLEIDWYDLLGNLLSTSAGSAIALRDGIADDVTITQTPPAGAVFCAVRPVIAATTIGEQFDILRAQVNRASSVQPFQIGRDIRVTLRASRVNIVENSSFEAGLNGWSNAGNTTLTRDTGTFKEGSASARLVYTGPPITGRSSSQVDDYAVYAFTAVVGRRYGVQVAQANDTPNAPTSLFVQTSVVADLGTMTPSTDIDGDLAVATSAPTGATPFTQDVIHRFAFVATDAQMYLVVGFRGAQTSDAVNFDTVIIEEASEGTDLDWRAGNPLVVHPYFDGSHHSATDDFFWEGEPYLSRSHYYRRRTIHEARLRDVLPRYLPFGATYTLLWARPEQDLPDYVSDDAILSSPDVVATAAVGASAVLRWKDDQHNGATLRLSWNVVAEATKSAGLVWDTEGRFSGTSQLVWTTNSNLYDALYGGTY